MITDKNLNKNNNKEFKNDLYNNDSEIISIHEKEHINIIKSFNDIKRPNNMNNFYAYQMCNHYIKTLFLSFHRIEKLRLNFPNRKNNIINLTNVIYNFMKNDEINLNSIYEIEKKIREMNINFFIELNFEKLIDFILNKLHEELNKKNNLNISCPKEEYEEKLIYRNFRKYYFEQNESFIQNIFFGTKEISTLYKCCSLKKYNFDLIKYICFDLSKIDKNKSLQNLIFEWEEPILENKFCKMYMMNSDSYVQNKLWDGPEILIIIIKNNKKILHMDKNIKTKKYEYNFLCGIFESPQGYNKNIFNVIYTNGNKMFAFENERDSKEIGNEFGSLSIYPHVLFYQRGIEIIIENTNNLEISNNRLETHILTESNYYKEENFKNTLICNNSYKQIDFNMYENKNDKKIILFNNNNNLNESIISNNNINLNISNDKVKTDSNINFYHTNKINDIKHNINNNNNLNSNINKIDNKKFNNNYMNNIYNNNNKIENNMNYNKLMNNNMTSNNNNLMNNNIQIINNNINFNENMNNMKENINNHNANLINDQYNNMMKNMIMDKSENKYNIFNNNIFKNTIRNENFFNMNNGNIYENNKSTESKNMIVLNFSFENGKELYLYVDESLNFSEVVQLLHQKYLWINNIKIKEYIFNHNKIILNKTIKENGLRNNSMIKIIEF